jgi:transcriptional regulator GlxA family with amidase domain
MLLAASGMLRGRPAVAHRACLEDLGRYGADVHAEARVIDDGDVLTAGGVTSAIDLALQVVERARGQAAALAGAQRIEHEPRGEVLAPSWRPSARASEPTTSQPSTATLRPVERPVASKGMK